MSDFEKADQVNEPEQIESMGTSPDEHQADAHMPVIEAESAYSIGQVQSPWKLYLPWMLAVFVLILDQGTKALVLSNMDLHERIRFIGDIVRWTYVQNTGMVFGMPPVGGRWVLVGLNFAAMLLFVFILWKIKNEPLGIRLILGGIVGGAIGNNIDRIRFGYVVDFIDVDLPDFLMPRWYVFNVADSFISVGITILILLMLLKPSLLKPNMESDSEAEPEAAEDEFSQESEPVKGEEL